MSAGLSSTTRGPLNDDLFGAAAGRDSIRVQRNFLYPPVVHVGDNQRVVRRTGKPVRPAKLADIMARFAEHPQNLAVERQLVNPAGLGIGR